MKLPKYLSELRAVADVFVPCFALVETLPIGKDELHETVSEDSLYSSLGLFSKVYDRTWNSRLFLENSLGTPMLAISGILLRELSRGRYR